MFKIRLFFECLRRGWRMGWLSGIREFRHHWSNRTFIKKLRDMADGDA